MTLKEANEAEFVSHGNEDDKLKIIVSKHKTAKSYGPAILYLSQDDATMFVHYRDSIRPNIPTSSNCDLLLVKANGEPFTKNYSYLVQTYAKSIGLIHKPPSLTATRKAGGKSILTNKEMEEMSRHMTHSTSTSEMYYRNRKGGKNLWKFLRKFKNYQVSHIYI